MVKKRKSVTQATTAAIIIRDGAMAVTGGRATISIVRFLELRQHTTARTLVRVVKMQQVARNSVVRMARTLSRKRRSRRASLVEIVLATKV